MESRAKAPDDRAVRARRGDARAYESLVEEHQAIAFRTAYLITGSAADAEEAAQEAFVRAWLALRRFRRGAEFRPWLLAIVANEARNRVRNRRRREGLAERAAADLAWQPPASQAPGEGDGRLRDALATLPERDRSVLACRFVLDLSEQETAGVLDIPARHRQVSHRACARAAARQPGGRGMTLERDLRALAAGFPDPPALAPGVSAGIARASRRRRRRRVAVLALALFLLVPATVLAVSPDLRHRVLETFGLRNAKVEVVEQLPAVPPAAPGVSSLQLGSLTTLQQARNELRLRIDPPTALGRPDAIYSRRAEDGRRGDVPVRAAHGRGAHRRAQARPRERAARRVQPGFPGQDGDAGRPRSRA